MGLRRAEFWSLSGVLLLALWAPEAVFAQAPRARTIYCCDVGAQPVCGDILPEACYGRAYREVSPSGLVRRVVPAPLSADEIARRNAEDRQRRLDEVARMKQQRLDEALLETYRSVEDLDRRRDREVADLDRTIHTLRERETALLVQQKELIEKGSGYPEGSMPADLEDDIRSLDGEIIAQRSIIDAKLRERSAVLDRFEEDRKRYLILSVPEGR